MVSSSYKTMKSPLILKNQSGPQLENTCFRPPFDLHVRKITYGAPIRSTLTAQCRNIEQRCIDLSTTITYAPQHALRLVVLHSHMLEITAIHLNRNCSASEGKRSQKHAKQRENYKVIMASETKH